MRYMILFAALMAPLVAAACGGSSTKPTPTTGITSNPTARTGAASPTAAAPKTGADAANTPKPSSSGVAEAEVIGIVGAVSTANRTIEINRLSGASVTRISVEPSTALRKAGGGSTTLAQIRPSDRIIARGRLNDRKDTLIAIEITVQDVVPGAQPGG